MGWNDRLPEDPYTPYESHDEQDAYDNWLNYVESLRAEEKQAGLSSANVAPEELTDTAAKMMAAKVRGDVSKFERVLEFFKTVTARKTAVSNAPDEHENENSR